MSCAGSPARLVGIAVTGQAAGADHPGPTLSAVTGQAAGADHPGPTLSAVTSLASTTGQVAL